MPNGFSKVRNMAQSFLRSGGREGIGANTLLNTLRETGLGYRRTDFLSDYRNYQRIPVQYDQMKYVGGDKRLANYNYIELPRFQKANYAYVVDVKVRDPATGREFDMRTTVSSDMALTRRQSNEAGLEGVLPAIDQSKFDIIGYDWENAYHLAGTEW
ncbi:unnamed protein product [marine sediment metagenome]|uniref:Uncharacterized protein n=1 Tax=marine sediment metagenome TaxID=412755 RepID=X1V950_9ZZZZ